MAFEGLEGLDVYASMRPPEFTGGNLERAGWLRPIVVLQ